MVRNRGIAAFIVALVGLMAPGSALAHPDEPRRDVSDGVADSPMEVHELHDQHGGEDGHLPGSSENVELVGQVAIQGAAPGRVADVAAFGTYAYVTVRDPVNCVGDDAAGVAVFDISDPTDPVQVGFIEATPGSQPGEGAQVVDLKTRAFRGQVLVFNNELCALGGEGGVSLWDVTDPMKPQVLTAHAGDDSPGGALSQFNQIHSAFAWQDHRKRAYVVLTDNEEDSDVDILDITDPYNPVLIAELDLNEFEVLQEQGTPFGEGSFLHDMVVQRVRGRWTMLLSYWDGGWVLLNVDDPANPTYIDDFDYPDPDTLTGLSPAEGNAHQAEFSPNGQLVIGTDEDFAPFRTDFAIATGTNAGAHPAGEFGWTVPLRERYPDGMSGPTIFGGSGCLEDLNGNGVSDRNEVPPASGLFAAPGQAKTVVFSRGDCLFSIKVESGQLAGYDAVIIGNSHAGSGLGEAPDAFVCGSQGHVFEPTVPALCIGHRAMHLLFNDTPQYQTPEGYAAGGDLPPIGTVGESITATAVFDAWGYVRLLDTATMTEVDAYAIEESLNPAFASGFGDLTVHEVAVDPWKKNLAYLSYYSGGLRVIEYGRQGMTEVGHYIHQEGNNFWGVEVHRLPTGKPKVGKETLILASDRDSGLWIFRYTGK